MPIFPLSSTSTISTVLRTNTTRGLKVSSGTTSAVYTVAKAKKEKETWLNINTVVIFEENFVQ